MKKTKLTRSLLAACSIVALSAVMYGCSSSGENAANTRAENAEEALAALQAAYDGTGDLTPAALNQLEADLAMTQAALTSMTGLRDGLQTDLDTANGEIARLTGELATMTGLRDGLQTDLDTMTGLRDGLQTDLDTMTGLRDGLQTDLDTMTGLRDDLQMQISGDPNDPMDMGLNGRIADLVAQIGDATDPASLMGQIASLTMERDGLQMQISGDPSDPADMGLNGQIASLTMERDGLQMQISGDPNDPADTGGLMGQIAALEERINGDPNDDMNNGLVGDLADARDEITRLEGMLMTVNTVSRLQGVASTATTDSAAAGMAADQALKDAMKYGGMLGVLDVNGDSGMAMANAQAVLDANQAAIQAVIDATAAKTSAENAKTEAEALDDDTAGKDALIAALDAAIEAADAQIKAAMAIRDHDDLEAEVEKVTGTDEDDPGTPADKAKEVADLINTALTVDAQHPTAVAIPDPHTTSDIVSALVMGPSDARGETFAQIFASRVVDKRIASGTGTAVVKAVSVDGMTAADVFSTVPGTAPGTDDGTQTATDVSYKGIAGTLFCAGTDCMVEDVTEGNFAGTSKLTGSWYFAPTADSMTTYLAGTGADTGTYSEEQAATYVRFGYWLSVAAADNDTTTINRYVSGPTAQGGAVYDVDSAVPAFADNRATYTGDALGMSVAWETDTKGKEVEGTRASGGFTADVTLTMSFGATPRLEGMITNFMGTGVDPNWSVDLDRTALASGTFTDGVTDGGGDDGVWTAIAWGGAASDPAATPNPAARPTGVYGAFDADFTNGAAVGVYNTRMQ